MVVVGRGFLGTHLIEQLSENGHQVIVLDRLRCDLCDEAAVAEAFKKIPSGATVFLSAAITRTASVDRNLFDQNYRIVNSVINAIPPNTRHIVYFSSVDVYGPSPACPIVESAALNPADHYSISKMVGEFLVRNAAAEDGISWTIFRLPGIYGPGDSGKSTISRMASTARKVGQIKLTSHPESERDFVWANDVACLAERAAVEQITGLFNVATGCSIRIADIAAAVAAQVGTEIQVVQVHEYAHLHPAKLQFDISKLLEFFPGLRMTELTDGLAAYVKTTDAGNHK